MYNGIINIYKEKGFTSHDVVAKLRGMLKQKKIGHTGTLDPDATGVLPVCLGNATKLCDMLTDKEKTYRAEFVLGKATDTQDISGKLINEADVEKIRETLGDGEIYDTIMSFVGEYSQIPPMYSAIKVNGKKLYELAREGIEIERKPRSVKILAIRDVRIAYPYISMEIDCSKGTYIRTLCYDIGLKLGTYGCMTSLERTRSGQFVKAEAYTLSEVEEFVKSGVLDEKIIPTDKAFDNLKSIHTDEALNKLLYNGNPIPLKYLKKNIKLENMGKADRGFPKEQTVSEWVSDDIFDEAVKKDESFRVYDCNNKFIGIYKIKDNLLKPEKLFL